MQIAGHYDVDATYMSDPSTRVMTGTSVVNGTGDATASFHDGEDGKMWFHLDLMGDDSLYFQPRTELDFKNSTEYAKGKLNQWRGAYEIYVNNGGKFNHAVLSKKYGIDLPPIPVEYSHEQRIADLEAQLAAK